MSTNLAPELDYDIDPDLQDHRSEAAKVTDSDFTKLQKLLARVEAIEEAEGPLDPYENPAMLPIIEYWNKLWCSNPDDRMWTETDKKWWYRDSKQVDILDPCPVRSEPPKTFVTLFNRVNDLVNHPSDENRKLVRDSLKELGALRVVFPPIGSRWRAKTGKRVIRVLEHIEGNDKTPPQVKVLNETEKKVYKIGLDKDASPHGYVTVE